MVRHLPTYICNLLSPYEPDRCLTSGRKLLAPKSHHLTKVDRAFAVCAPKIWNSLQGISDQQNQCLPLKLILKLTFIVRLFLNWY
ncbi:hypothetical protein LDENG_00087910 [Lucifuga dentata]|nr:hypothetical protein LDENG_00087910 [Lucifuga dentata]